MPQLCNPTHVKDDNIKVAEIENIEFQYCRKDRYNKLHFTAEPPDDLINILKN